MVQQRGRPEHDQEPDALREAVKAGILLGARTKTARIFENLTLDGATERARNGLKNLKIVHDAMLTLLDEVFPE